jgi:hypothetical protein
MIVLADRGRAGRELERYAAGQVHVLLAVPTAKDERHRFGSLGGMRQLIESVNDTLKGRLNLEPNGGRTPAVVLTLPIAQRLLALASAIWHNLATSTTRLRALTAYDH